RTASSALSLSLLFFFITLLPPRSPLFPYTTLFRSLMRTNCRLPIAEGLIPSASPTMFVILHPFFDPAPFCAGSFYDFILLPLHPPSSFATCSLAAVGSALVSVCSTGSPPLQALPVRSIP